METSQVVLESAKFLRQLERQAIENVKEKVLVNAGDNKIFFSSFYMQNRVSSIAKDLKFYVKCSLNGNELQIEGTFEDMMYNKHEVAKKIYEQIMSQVGTAVAEMLDSHITKMIK